MFHFFIFYFIILVYGAIGTVALQMKINPSISGNYYKMRKYVILNKANNLIRRQKYKHLIMGFNKTSIHSQSNLNNFRVLSLFNISYDSPYKNVLVRPMIFCNTEKIYDTNMDSFYNTQKTYNRKMYSFYNTKKEYSTKMDSSPSSIDKFVELNEATKRLFPQAVSLATTRFILDPTVNISKDANNINNTNINNINDNLKKYDKWIFVLLHGFLGSRRNLRSIARQLNVKDKTTAILADLRDHGDSTKNCTTNAATLAEDIFALLHQELDDRLNIISQSVDDLSKINYIQQNNTYEDFNNNELNNTDCEDIYSSSYLCSKRLPMSRLHKGICSLLNKKRKLGIHLCIIGHSLGGLTAMEAALTEIECLKKLNNNKDIYNQSKDTVLDGIVVLDISPAPYSFKPVRNSIINSQSSKTSTTGVSESSVICILGDNNEDEDQQNTTTIDKNAMYFNNNCCEESAGFAQDVPPEMSYTTADIVRLIDDMDLTAFSKRSEVEKCLAHIQPPLGAGIVKWLAQSLKEVDISSNDKHVKGKKTTKLEWMWDIKSFSKTVEENKSLNLHATPLTIHHASRQFHRGRQPGLIQYHSPCIFIRGSKSHWLEFNQHGPSIKRHFPNAKMRTVFGTGHWLHAEKTKETVEHINEFLNDLYSQAKNL